MRDQAIGQPDVLSMAMNSPTRPQVIITPSLPASDRRITRPAGEKNSADGMLASLLSASIHY